uniref:NPHP4 C2-like domain-containing protein n=1 Tax=Strigamia maritima TaxID=126957 RepID=T1IZU8_STRMM
MNSVPFISPAWDRIQRSSEDNIAFNLIIKSVENIPKSTPLVQESRRNYIVQIHLYDAVYKQFFGRICRGGIRKEENDNETINFKEEFYFHTSFCDENILLVIEVLEIVNCDEKCAGWTSMRLFRQLDEGLCVNNGVFGLGLFYGSCCSLLYVDSTPDFAPSSEKILGCQIDVSLAVFKPLLKISYLIPENYLVSQRELIPGVRNVNDNSCTLKGMRKLKRISLKPCTSCTIHDLNISIGITIDQFETQLRQHLITQNGQTFSDVEVTERRLQIGCHNGCDFIEEPHTYHLVSGSTSGPTRIASGKRHNWSFRSRQSRNFMLRNKIILNNIPAESGIKLIFVIEYVINISSTDTKIYSRKLNIGIFGAVWEIFPECFKSSSGTKNINLNTGNDDNIQQLLKILLYNAEIDSKETPSIKFSYQIGKKNKSKLRLSIESSDSVSTQTNPSVAVDDERNEEIDSPRVDDVCEVVGNVAQRIHPWGSRKTSGNRLSRSLHCFLSSFAPIIDRWNQPATLVDSEDGDAMDLFAEERDLLKRNEVVLQFLAFKKLNRSSKTRAITISFQFFQFDIYFTESLFLIPTNTPDEPCTLKQMENGKLKQIPEIRFVIDPSHWTNKTHDEFIDYLTKFNVNFDVFDSETQFYLGQCTTPIKNLCRGGREAVEFTRELEIVAPLDPNGVNGVTDDFSREICGYLYCKLGNIGQIADPINQYEFPVNIVKSGSRIGQNDHVIKARSLRDVRESSEKKVNENWEEKLRKLNRMEIVRAAHPDGKMMKLFQAV